MKSDNIFRFVSIRPPEDKHVIESVPGDEGATEEVETRLRDHLRRRVSDRSDAAGEVGREIINSDDYVRSHEWGGEILGASPDVHRALRQAREKPDWTIFQEKARNFLRPLMPSSSRVTIEAFLKSDAFAEFERTVWRSYFATILNPYERPKDSESLAIWLVFLHLLKSKSAAEFSKRAAKVDYTRPAVPASFFFEDFAPPEGGEATPPAPTAPDPKLEAAKRLRDEISRMQSARKELNDLFAERVRATPRSVRTVAPKRTESAPSAETERKGPAAATQGSVSFESSQAAAWKLSDEDFRMRGQVIETVRAAGVVPELSSIPDAINRLDTRIAEVSADLSQMELADELAVVGKTFVRLRRPAAVNLREIP